MEQPGSPEEQKNLRNPLAPIAAFSRRMFFAVLAAGAAAVPSCFSPHPMTDTPSHEKREHAHEHASEEELNAAFDRQERAYNNLLALNGKTIDNPEAFRDGLEIVICCMDERVQAGPGQKKLALAGSGILLNPDQLKVFAASLRGLNIQSVTYHEGCGACALHCKNKGIDPEKAEEEGRIFAQKLMTELGLPAGIPKRIGFGEMQKHEPTVDPRFHHARAIIVDTTGRFRPGILRLPGAFELSARYFPDVDQVAIEAEIAIGIAFGDHGLGGKRFRGNGRKLALVVVENPHDRARSGACLRRLEPLLGTYRETLTLIRTEPTAQALK